MANSAVERRLSRVLVAREAAAGSRKQQAHYKEPIPRLTNRCPLEPSFEGFLLLLAPGFGPAAFHRRGVYAFGGHLRWSWALALGYVASVLTRLLVSAQVF
ncbi:MAG TPA: hypothetical protein VGL99_21880 [Chloroflexota bacterium]